MKKKNKLKDDSLKRIATLTFHPNWMIIVRRANGHLRPVAIA